jgi:hypothetical protein
VSFGRPKSRIFRRPSLVRNRFSGFKSQCITSASCAAASPRATSTPQSRPPAVASDRAAGDPVEFRPAAVRSRCENTHRAARRARSKQCSDGSEWRWPAPPVRSRVDAPGRETGPQGVLDGHVPFQRAIAGAVHFAHSTAPSGAMISYESNREPAGSCIGGQDYVPHGDISQDHRSQFQCFSWRRCCRRFRS